MKETQQDNDMEVPINKVFRSRFTSKLFNCIVANPGITGTELHKKYGFLPTVISRSLQTLKRAGLVKTVLEEGGKAGVKRIYPSFGIVLNKQLGDVLNMKEVEAKAMDKKECVDHHNYKISLDGKMILCAKCGRIKVIKEGGEWRVLY